MGQVAVAITPSLTLRIAIAIATAFAVSAAVAGFHVAFALSQIGMPSLAWREIFACPGAVCVGGTAWMRLIVFAEPRPFELAGVVENPSQPVLPAATREA
ncbi:hypothetical protein [Bradyrhizobium sp. USDA 241]|uniref:hypothetical protein n=1 Tax=Bradyrhizobium TaxID=374 RepID=UPI003C763090